MYSSFKGKELILQPYHIVLQHYFPNSITFLREPSSTYTVRQHLIQGRQGDTRSNIHPYCGLKPEKCKFVCVKADLQCPHPQADTLELLCLSWACQNNRDVEKTGMFTTSLWNQIQAARSALPCESNRLSHSQLQSCSDELRKCAYKSLINASLICFHRLTRILVYIFCVWNKFGFSLQQNTPINSNKITSTYVYTITFHSLALYWTGTAWHRHLRSFSPMLTKKCMEFSSFGT